MKISDNFNELIMNITEDNKRKFMYVLNFWSENFIINNKEYIMEKLNNIDLEELNSFNRPLENEYKQVFELIDGYTIINALFKEDEILRAHNIEIDSLIFLTDYLNTDKLKRDAIAKGNNIYRKFINTDVLSSIDILSIIKENFSEIKNNKDFNMLDIEENIHNALREKMVNNIENDYTNIEQFKSKKTIGIAHKDIDLDFVELATKTNKIYDIENELLYGIIKTQENIDFTKFDDIVEEAGFLSNYPDIIDTLEYAEKCFMNSQSIDIKEVIKILEEIEEDPNLHEYENKIRELVIYQKYGLFETANLGDNLIENLDILKVNETLKYTHGIYNNEAVAIRAILDEKFTDFSRDDINKLKSYLYHFDIREISKKDIAFLKENAAELKEQNYTITDLFYIKNIRGSEESKIIINNFPNDIKEEVLKLNLDAKDYEIINILDALHNCKEDKNIKKEEDFSNTQRNLSSIPIEKRDELRKLIMETKFKNYKPNLNINKDITIGIELETEGISYKVIKSLVANDKLRNLLFEKQNIKSDLSDWKVTRDSTVANGVEMISPILKDTPKDWESLQNMCLALKSIGGVIDESCGGHIHIGSNILGTDGDAWKNLFKIWANCEAAIYKISNPANEKHREDVGLFAPPTKSIINDMLEKGSINIKSEEDIINISKEYTRMYVEDMSTSGKYKGLNLSPIASGRQDTIEFRIPNGQLDPIEIQRNINLYARIVDVSKKILDDPEYKKDIFDKVTDEKTTEEERVLGLLDLTFDDVSDKAVYYERYLSREKDLVLSGKSYNEYVNKKPVTDNDIRYR